MISAARDQHRTNLDEPRREVLQGPTQSLSALRWQGVLWVPYRQIARGSGVS